MAGVVKAFIVLGVTGIAGAAMLAPGSRPPDNQRTSTAAMAGAIAASIPGRERFRVLVTGARTDCVIEKGEEITHHKTRLLLGPDCGAEIAGLADVAYWRVQNDGSVALLDGADRIQASFTSGDGLAFESFGGGLPPIALVSEAD